MFIATLFVIEKRKPRNNLNVNQWKTGQIMVHTYNGKLYRCLKNKNNLNVML